MPASTTIWRRVQLNPIFSNYVSRSTQGSVVAPAFSRPVLLTGRENMNRAVHGDVVAIEIFDEKDWKVHVDQVIDQEGPLVFTGSFSAF